MKPANLENLYELSPLQQGILFHSLYEPGSGVYVEQLLFTFEGDLRIPVFVRAWQAVVDRHPVLRTSFYWQNLDKPLQAVHRNVHLPLEELDWRTFSQDEQEQRLNSYLKEDRLRGFEPSKPPLIRLTIFQMADNRWKFLLQFSHLVMDGWSVGLVLQDFVTLYKAFWRAESVSLTACRPYYDYIAWLRNQDRSRTEAFWRRALAGIPGPTVLDLGAVPASPRTDEATHERVELDFTDVANSLKCFAHTNQLTLNTVIQGAWSLLLSRLTGQDDVITGSTMSGRVPEFKGSEGIVGVMIETLPVRSRVAPGTPVAGWLREFQAEQVAARQHNSASLTEIHSWSEIPRGQALFESIVVFENVPIPHVSFREEGLDIPEVVYDGRPHYPLSLMIFPGAELPLRITYDRGRYDTAMIQRTLEQLKTLLQSIVAAPSQQVHQLKLLPGRQREALEIWNQNHAEEDGNILNWFDEIATLQPHSIAVAMNSRQVSYRELCARARGIAAMLDVKPEEKVAVFLERGPELIGAMLGIIAGGGVYVPVDPSHPKARISQIIESSQAQVMISSRTLVQKQPTFSGRLLWIEDVPPSAGSLRSLGGNIPSDRQLAYIMYTSGSTGSPKGAQIEHAGLVNHLISKRESLNLTPADVVAQNAPCCFDVSIWQMLAPLLAGAKVQVIPEVQAQDPEQLMRAIDIYGVTVLETVPVMLRAMVTHAHEQLSSRSQLATLKWLISNAEPLSGSLARDWAALYQHVKLLNAYGPTECSDDVTHYEVPRCASFDGDHRIPIGKPIRNTRLYVLDKWLGPTPVGVPGEIYIGGAGVGRGYLGQADLTAEHFIPDPFANVSGARLYRTGDQGRWLSNGTLEFLGRMDQQVKVRGSRIELGEIEAVLRKYPGIKEVVVATQDGTDSEKLLVAYVVSEQHATLSSRELLEFIEDKLPSYMVPATVVFLPSLPVTRSGKVNRRALPKPAWGSGEWKKSYIGPRSPREKLLASIWSNVLRLDQVSVDDNFFELGGHSLLATQVMSRVRSTFAVDLPIRALFDNPTVASLIKTIEAQETGVI